MNMMKHFISTAALAAMLATGATLATTGATLAAGVKQPAGIGPIGIVPAPTPTPTPPTSTSTERDHRGGPAPHATANNADPRLSPFRGQHFDPTPLTAKEIQAIENAPGKKVVERDHRFETPGGGKEPKSPSGLTNIKQY